MDRQPAAADQVLVGMNKTRRAYNGRLRQLRGFTGAMPQSGEKLVCLRNNRKKGLLNGALFTVKRPAAAAGTSETTSATSRRWGLMPTAAPPKRKPFGIFNSASEEIETGRLGPAHGRIERLHGLTRGAFYAHFKSKDDLFAEVIRAGHGLLARTRAAGPEAAIDAYLAKDDLAANALACTLAALPSDVARAPLPARLAYANALHGLIGELARDRPRKLDADATAAAILAVGAVSLARASGDTSTG
mgnify:CR=1 FL=1